MSALIKLGRGDYSLVVDLAKKGCSEATIAKSLFVSPATFRALKARDEDLADALAIGRAHLHDELVSMLVTKARNGDTTALIFACKSLLGFRDHGPDTNTAPVNVVNINLPAARSPEDYARVVDVTPLKESES